MSYSIYIPHINVCAYAKYNWHPISKIWIVVDWLFGDCKKVLACILRNAYTYIHTYIHRCIDAYILTYVHTCIPTNIQTYKHTNTFIHTYINTYEHTYKQVSSKESLATVDSIFHATLRMVFLSSFSSNLHISVRSKKVCPDHFHNWDSAYKNNAPVWRWPTRFGSLISGSNASVPLPATLLLYIRTRTHAYVAISATLRCRRFIVATIYRNSTPRNATLFDISKISQISLTSDGSMDACFFRHQNRNQMQTWQIPMVSAVKWTATFQSELQPIRRGVEQIVRIVWRTAVAATHATILQQPGMILP